MLRTPVTRAVVVGISDYQRVSDLDYADRDATAFADYLQSEAGGMVPAANIKLLINEKATQMEFVMALSWLQEESLAGDKAIIYFSGHGDVEKKTASQRGFLLTYDAPATTYMAGGAFPIIFLQDIISTLSSEERGVNVLLIADACRAGKLAGNAIGGNHVTATELSKAFARETKILSCQPEQLSQESDRWGNGRGVFSYHLIEGLIGMANSDPDDQVTLKELGRYLEDEVGKSTAETQIPMILGDRTQVIAQVDPASLARLMEQKALNQDSVSALSFASNKRIPKGTDPDSVIWQRYQRFQQAMTAKNLLYPKAEAAYTLYEQIKDENLMRPYRSDMKRELAVALHDEAQQAINAYLTASPRELRKRWTYDERYEHYPEYLATAAELLGPAHFMYQDLRARQSYFEGVRLRLQGEREKDTELFRRALEKQAATLKIDSSAAYAYNELGLLHRRLKNYQMATHYFQQALVYSPTWVLPMANLIANYTDIDQLDAALVTGKEALRVDSTFALTHYNLGVLYGKRDERPAAIRHYLQAIELDPDYADSYYNLGILYFQEDQLESSEQMFLRYSESFPEDVSIWSNLGYVADLLNKDDDAYGYFQRALALDPEYATTYLNLGEYHARRTQLPEAVKAYQEYARLRPDSPNGFYLLARVYARQRDAKQALATLEQAIQLGYKDAEALQQEEDFKNLRDNKKFNSLLSRLR